MRYVISNFILMSADGSCYFIGVVLEVAEHIKPPSKVVREKVIEEAQ